VLGPLPTFYRVIVSVCALLSFVGIGAWLSFLMPEVLVAEVGTGVGLGLGVVAVLLLLHQPARPGAGHQVRVRSHRHH
jgi:hypothetical protein